MRAGDYVIVATGKRPWSIVAGTMVSRCGGTVRLSGARMIVYYASSARGLYGLARRGPGAGRVSDAVDECIVRDVEHVIAASAEARAAIEAEPWS